MTLPREPRIHPVPIEGLRPTQITVGMREVKAKRKSWRDHPDRVRRRIKRKHVDDNFSDALVRALKLAKSGEADFLPGWCGPSSEQ